MSELDTLTEETAEPIEDMPEEAAEEEATEAAPTAEQPEVDRIERLLAQERAAAEYAEFGRLFPGASVSALPDEVAASVRSGVPLAAAYALYERRRAVDAASAEAINEKNRGLSFEVNKSDSQDGYFSYAEVKAMSPSEVRQNYSRIIDSMSHWH